VAVAQLVRASACEAEGCRFNSGQPPQKEMTKKTRKLVKILVIINSLSLLILSEILFWRVPYISIFFLVFALIYYLNTRYFLSGRSDRAGKVVNRSKN
jgi:Na+/melibiose symporter-like transporter